MKGDPRIERGEVEIDLRVVLDRIRRLLALGTSPNLHEAELALATAARLMERHRLTRADLGMFDGEGIHIDPEAVFVGVRLVTSWRSVLANKLARLEGCRALEEMYLSPKCKTELARLVLVGRPEQIAVTRHLYRYLERAIEAECRAARRRRRVRGAAAAETFRVAAIETVMRRLRRAKELARREHLRAGGSSTAIERVSAEGDTVEAWLRKQCGDIGPERYASDPVSARAEAAGRDAGERIALHPGLDEAKNARRLA